jgi:MFS transporter, MHS family, shikimate and dehydroshikimate transport protein
MDSSPQNSTAKVIAASFIGTAIEWYDFFLYGTAAALVFNKLFFPTFDPLVGTMAAFATYAVGFVARPLGGIVFGHFGDRVGRKSTLVVTLILVGVSTFLIGVLPIYESAGVVAPALLVALRFVQGLGVGGEWAGAVLMIVEHGQRGRRGFQASFVQAGAPAGLLLATGVFSLSRLLPDDDFFAWGWRVPFLLGLVPTLVGLFIRMKLFESPVFAKAIEERPAVRIPVLEAVRSNPQSVLLAMGARMAENSCYYIFTVFSLTYVGQVLGLGPEVALNGVLIAGAIHLVVTIACGGLSDRVGRRPVYLGGAVLLGILAFPFFWLMDTATTAGIWLAITLGMLAHAAMYGPQAAFMSELFGTRVRYSGASLGYQLAAPLAGGLAPFIAAALLRWSGNEPWPIAVYLIAMASVTIMSVTLAAETSRHDLKDREPE